MNEGPDSSTLLTVELFNGRQEPEVTQNHTADKTATPLQPRSQVMNDGVIDRPAFSLNSCLTSITAPCYDIS